MKNKDSYSTKYIDVLDGIRAVSVIIVMIFHFWQQTWIFPTIKTPFLKFIGVPVIDFTPFARVGYLFVDMMILISGMLLFLPVARNVLMDEPLPRWRDYFKKRAIRILPSYLFCILSLFVYELIMGGYGKPVDAAYAVRDLVSHLFFMHTWRVDTYLSTRLNVVLWTLAVEVWFYILFPVIASVIRRGKKEKNAVLPLIRMVVVAVIMVLLSAAYIHGYVLNSGSAFSNTVDGLLHSVGSDIRSSYLSIVINQLPAFFGTYAVGMIGAFVYVGIARNIKPSVWVGAAATIISVGSIYFMVRMIKQCASLDPSLAQQWQIEQRLVLALVFMALILSTAFSFRWYRFLFSNKLMRFLSIISYNLYIWHQWLCVEIKNVWRLPPWEGSDPPNTWTYGRPLAQIEAGKQWSAQYALIITLFAFGAAILVTFLIERPAADLLNGRPSIYNGKLKALFKKKSKTSE